MLYLIESGPADGPAIGFLHGGGLSAWMWQPQMERLLEYHCLAPDLPEQGQSVEIKPFTLTDSARRVAEIIRAHVPSGYAAVVGLSLGGAVGLELMRVERACINHLIASGISGQLSRFLGNILLSTAWLYRLFSRQALAELSYKQRQILHQYHDMFVADLAAINQWC